MKERSLGLTGTRVSELCLGTMNFGNPRFGIDEKASLEVIHRYLDGGGNFLDTADAYSGGASEEIVGKAISGRRDSVVLATKAFFPVVVGFGDPPPHANALGSSRKHLTSALHASLRRLGTDYVDLYQVHCWDPLTPIEETLSTLDGFVRQGLIRYAGLSNYAAWQIAESRLLSRMHGWEPFVTAQMQYSLICRTIEHDVTPVCQRHGVGILAWSPLGQGVLTGKYRPQEEAAPGYRFSAPAANEAAAAWRSQFLNDSAFRIVEVVRDVATRLEAPATAVSLAWLLQRPAVSSVIIGPKTAAQLDENLRGAVLKLPTEAIDALTRVSSVEPRYPEWFISRAPRST